MKPGRALQNSHPAGADNLGCNLEPRCESMDGCLKWRRRAGLPPRGRDLL